MTFRSNQSTATFNRKDKTYYSSNNVTAQLTNDFRLKFAVNLSPKKEEGRLPTIDGSSSPTANFAIDQELPSVSYSGNADYVINSNWFAGVRGGYFVRDAHESGVFEGTRYVFNNSTNIGMAGVPANLQRAHRLLQRAHQLAHRPQQAGAVQRPGRHHHLRQLRAARTPSRAASRWTTSRRTS